MSATGSIWRGLGWWRPSSPWPRDAASWGSNPIQRDRSLPFLRFSIVLKTTKKPSSTIVTSVPTGTTLIFSIIPGIVGPDGAVVAYKGFHPHMLGTTNYAFMRDRDQWMLEIREKKPFTDNRMNEYASNGTYYFRKGSYVKEYFPKLMSQDINVEGEFYVSMVLQPNDREWSEGFDI